MEVKYCYDIGIPHSEFLVRWQGEDRAKVAAVTLEKSSVCTMCGTSQREWDEDPDAYAAVLMTCQGCQRREIMQDDDTPRSKGTSVRLISRMSNNALQAQMARKKADGTLRPKRRRGMS